MIITLIAIAVFIIGVILYVIDNKCICSVDLGTPAIFCMIVSGLFSFALLSVTFGVHVTSDVTYQETLYEKSVLEYRITEEDLSGNEMLYSQILEFNKDLYRIKKWANNPWTSWFNYSSVAKNIDYIEIPGVQIPGRGAE